jgi:hypothetical protein
MEAEAVRARIRPETLCIHLWNKEIARSGSAVPGSLITRVIDGSWRTALAVGGPTGQIGPMLSIR